MSIVNRIVDKVYVINMDSQPNRMEHVDRQLKLNSIDYTRFAAIDGASVGNSKFLTSTCNTICTDGIKGCALSHRAIWEEMVLNNYQHVLVLEDDIDIVPDFNEKFKAAWDSVPIDFDVIWVGCKFICDDSAIGKALTVSGFMDASKRVNDKILETAGTVGTHAYILSRRCAEKFLSKPIKWHIDTEMSRWVKEDGLKSYAMSSLPIQTRFDAAESSTLSEKYPKLLNSLLDIIPVSETDSASWILGENHFKLFGVNWNALSLLLVLGMLATPLPYLWLWALWIAAEFLVSKDLKNTVKMGAPLVLLWGLRVSLKGPARKMRSR